MQGYFETLVDTLVGIYAAERGNPLETWEPRSTRDGPTRVLPLAAFLAALAAGDII